MELYRLIEYLLYVGGFILIGAYSSIWVAFGVMLFTLGCFMMYIRIYEGKDN